MFKSRKKTNTSGPQPEYNPSSGVFTIPSRMEKIEREKKAARFHIIFFAVLFALLFGWMCFYFTQTAIEDKVELFNNDYNKRDELLEARNRRGSIYASDEETVLAETQAELDEDGNAVQTRVYPFGRVFAHALGYSLMGGSGLEEHFKYELLHSNVPLSDKVRCDNKENADERLYPGNDLITTLDPDLQQACYDAMGNYRGAVIVTEPSTGKILAMVSKPDFDPNEIAEDWDDLLSDNESGTLLNRVTQGLYPPGSTFKIVDCIDLLTEDPESAENYSYDCSGIFEEAGESDPGSMSDTLRTLLFNHKLPYDLPYVRSSINMPDTLSTEGIMQMSIGQGTTSMTPLHLNMITCAVANSGILMKPHLAEELRDANGRVLRTYDPEQYGALMTEEVSDTLREFMRAVVTDGTARSLKGRDYEAAGKTGSAEFDNNKSSHAWFTGFAPYDDPQVSVTVLIEGKGMGSSYAVPVAGHIFDAFFED